MGDYVKWYEDCLLKVQGKEATMAVINPLFEGNRSNLVIQAALEGYQSRHRAIVHNIANVDTPGFERIQVDFEEQLKRATKDLRPRLDASGSVDTFERLSSLDSFRPEVSTDRTPPLRADGSNVSIDREMADLSYNASKIRTLTELMIRNYSMVKAAIRGRTSG